MSGSHRISSPLPRLAKHQSGESNWSRILEKVYTMIRPTDALLISIEQVSYFSSLFIFAPLGVGLIEIVTDPVFSTSSQAAAFVNELATLLKHLRVCSANMSTGEMRVDINVSIGPSVSQQGSVVEIKNVNSLRAIRHAIGETAPIIQ